MAYPQFSYPYGNVYNPVNPWAQQPQSLPQPAPGQQPVQPAQAPAQAFSCHPVTSREEAVAAQAEYFGAGTIMPDLAHNMIYLKRFNSNTGASDFFDFALCQAQEPKQVRYVTQEEFEKFREEMLAAKKPTKRKMEVPEDE